jgi:hypothetical protein
LIKQHESTSDSPTLGTIGNQSVTALAGEQMRLRLKDVVSELKRVLKGYVNTYIDG